MNMYGSHKNGTREKLNGQGGVMAKKDKKTKEEKTNIDKAWDLVSDLNPY